MSVLMAGVTLRVLTAAGGVFRDTSGVGEFGRAALRHWNSIPIPSSHQHNRLIDPGRPEKSASK